MQVNLTILQTNELRFDLEGTASVCPGTYLVRVWFYRPS